MKIFLTVLVLCLLAICSSFPVENDDKNTLAAVDADSQYDADMEHLRLVRQFNGAYGGYPVGYVGNSGGYADQSSSSSSWSSASSSSSSSDSSYNNYYGS